MRLPSKFIPQADILEDVIKVVHAVDKGATTFQDIAYHIGKVERQGRYYRLAAEIIGLISNTYNHSQLTQRGKDLLSASSKDQNNIIRQVVLDSKLFKRLIPFFELHPNGLTKRTLENFMEEATERVGASMIDRRVSTVISWLSSIGLLKQLGSRYIITEQLAKDNDPIEYEEMSEPLLPSEASLKEYNDVAERAKKAQRIITIMRDDAVLERATNEHRKLVNLIATRLRIFGVLPRYNQLIDLAARVEEVPYIFEMKSLTQSNARAQIRTGVSQLYEYRYLQSAPNACLVLVVEASLPDELNWMQSFLEKDRQIRLIWDGNNELYSSPETKKELPFLW
jgi:hypothetical protein